MGQEMPNDIAAELRVCAAIEQVQGSIFERAADEIERLRKRLAAEENAYDILRHENEHLQTDRNNLALEVERLQKCVNEFENRFLAGDV